MNLKPLNNTLELETKNNLISKNDNKNSTNIKELENSIVIQSSELILDNSPPNYNNTKSIDNIQTKTFELSNKKILNSGRNNLLKFEKNIKVFLMFFNLFLILSMIVIILLFAFSILKIPNYGYYSIPIIMIFFSLYIFTSAFIEFKGIKKLIKYYAEENSMISSSLIADFFIRLQKKQINQIWFTIFYLFYVGIFTLIFWGIQNANWFNGLLNFKEWINNAFPTPFTPYWATIFFASTILLVIILSLIFSLIRRSHSINLLVFFGKETLNIEKIEEIRKAKHKLYAKIFLFSILIILIIPIVIYFIIKGIKK